MYLFNIYNKYIYIVLQYKENNGATNTLPC